MVDLSKFGISEGKGKYYEEAVYRLALIYNVCNNEMTAYLKDFNLTPGKLNILLAIKHQGGEHGISQVDISKHLIVTPSNMTKLLDKLEKEEMVTRSALPGDRRVNIIKITQKGSALLDGMWGGYEQSLSGLMSNLEKKDQKVLAGHLKKWLDSLVEE